MPFKGKLQKTFNWLSGHAGHSWTLGELALNFTPAPMERYSDTTFNRAGRIIERTVTLGAIFGAVAAGLVPGVLAGVGVVAIGKLFGLSAGHFANKAATAIHRKLG